MLRNDKRASINGSGMSWIDGLLRTVFSIVDDGTRIDRWKWEIIRQIEMGKAKGETKALHTAVAGGNGRAH